MKITVCIGSSCHLKGSRQIVERLKQLINEKDLSEKIELAGTFCMANCTGGVCIAIDDEHFSLKPENTDTFFETEVLKRLY